MTFEWSNEQLLADIAHAEEKAATLCGPCADDHARLAGYLRALLAAYEQEPVANSEAADTLQKICNIFRIGIQAQTQSTILANVENVVRFADQLHAIEREFFMVPGEPDEDYPEDEPADVCLVNCWGSTTERYVEQFRAALIRVAHAAPSIPAAVPEERTWLFYCEKYPEMPMGDAIIRAVEWNACRAVMLQAEPVKPVIPAGYMLVPVEPTENMVIEGFESAPDRFFSEPEIWEAYQEMSGCEQAAHRARLCWAAMLAAAPKEA